MDGYNLNNRLNSVRDTTSEKKLKRYALDDYSEKVREIAVSKITDPALLCYIVKNDRSINVAKRAVQNIDDEGLKAKTASLVGYCDDLPDSDEKEKLLRYIADIPLLKDEDKEVAEEALKCIKESYNTLDSDANSEIMEKPMEDTEKKEQTPAQTPAQDEVPAPAPAPAEPQNGEAPAEEKKEDGCGDMAKLADAIDAISKKLDSLLEAKAEPKADEKPAQPPPC